MTDKELLEYAAKAFGIEGYYYKGFLNDDYVDGIVYIHEDGRQLVFEPLANDGDALRLAVKVGLCVCVRGRATQVEPIPTGGCCEESWSKNGNDPHAATRRAIVRAAAEIGKAMP